MPKCCSIPLSYRDKTYRCIHTGHAEEISEHWMTHGSRHSQHEEFRGISVKRMESIVNATRSVLAVSVFSPLQRVFQVFGYPRTNSSSLKSVCQIASILCGVETLAMVTTWARLNIDFFLLLLFYAANIHFQPVIKGFCFIDIMNSDLLL